MVGAFEESTRFLKRPALSNWDVCHRLVNFSLEKRLLKRRLLNGAGGLKCFEFPIAAGPLGEFLADKRLFKFQENRLDFDCRQMPSCSVRPLPEQEVNRRHSAARLAKQAKITRITFETNSGVQHGSL